MGIAEIIFIAIIVLTGVVIAADDNLFHRK